MYKFWKVRVDDVIKKMFKVATYLRNHAVILNLQKDLDLSLKIRVGS